MFRRVRESISNRSSHSVLASSKSKKLRRRLKRQNSKDTGEANLQGFREDSQHGTTTSNGDDDLSRDDRSVQSNITVETTRTASNENKKPLSDPNYRPLTQLFCGPPPPEAKENPEILERYDPVTVLESAQSDITKLSIYLKEIGMTRSVATAFLGLVRGDNRSWEAIAVDILRQKARWELITIEDCQGEYLDCLLQFLLTQDNCEFLHFSNILLTPHAAHSLQALVFSKSLTKLQLDLIDLSFALPTLGNALTHNTSLKCLIASRCGLGDESLQILIQHLPKQLEELRIFGNMCRSLCLSAIATLLPHSQTLKILDLSYQHVALAEEANKKERAFDITSLTKALQSNKVLKVLDMDNTGIDDDQLKLIVEALSVNTTLEEVMLNHNRITGVGIAHLASQFGNMNGLKKISMYSNLFEAPQVSNVVENSLDEAENKQHAQEDRPPATISAHMDSGNTEGTTNRRVSTLDDETILEEFIDEETVIEEIVMEEEEEEEIIEEDEDGNDDGEEGSYLSDNSSAPPPSADFREPDEVDEDQKDLEASEESEEDPKDLGTSEESESPPESMTNETKDGSEEEDSVVGIIVN